MGPLSSGVPDRGVLGSEVLGDPLVVEVCEDVVEAPSIESTDDLRCGSAVATSSSFPRENCEENCFLFPPLLFDPAASVVPKISLDPPPGGFNTLLEILVSSETPTVKLTDMAMCI